jgi:hypothetical protein
MALERKQPTHRGAWERHHRRLNGGGRGPLQVASCKLQPRGLTTKPMGCEAGSQGHVSTTGVHKSEKKEVCGQPTVEARARTRDGSRSRSAVVVVAGGEHWQSRAKRAAATAAAPCPASADRALLPLCG